MSELEQGEFRKRLRAIWEKADENYEEGPLAIMLDGVNELFDEVAKESPKKHWDGNYWVYYTEEIDVWLEKWFATVGEKIHTIQVTGGCTGHIDITKLQNLEKQE